MSVLNSYFLLVHSNLMLWGNINDVYSVVLLSQIKFKIVGNIIKQHLSNFITYSGPDLSMKTHFGVYGNNFSGQNKVLLLNKSHKDQH